MSNANQLLQPLTILEDEVKNLLNTKPGDLEQLSVKLSQQNILSLVDKLTEPAEQRAALLRFQKLLNTVHEQLAAEKKQLFAELEKFQLAKKGSARYHDMQET